MNHHQPKTNKLFEEFKGELDKLVEQTFGKTAVGHALKSQIFEARLERDMSKASGYQINITIDIAEEKEYLEVIFDEQNQEIQASETRTENVYN